MKKNFLILVIAITNFLFVQETTKAQDDVSFNKKQKVVKNEDTTEMNKKREKKIFILPDMSMSIDIERGFVLGTGFRFVSGTKKINPHYININFSVPFAGASEYTAFGLSYKTIPIKGKFGRMWAFGLDCDLFFKSRISSYSEFFFGGKVKNTFGKTSGFWETKRLVLAPRVDFLIPIKNWKIGISSNPLMVGYWDYFSPEKKFGEFSRWYDASIIIEHTFLTKKYKKFREEK